MEHLSITKILNLGRILFTLTPAIFWQLDAKHFCPDSSYCPVDNLSNAKTPLPWLKTWKRRWCIVFRVECFF